MATNSVEKWFDLLERADKASGAQEWDTRCKRIRKKYLYEGSATTRHRRYQLLWSNIQQLQSSIYSKTPKAVVKRRFNDKDPVARVASTILERAINFSLDTGDFHAVFKKVRDDFLLYGRGVARVYYEPTYSRANDTEEDFEEATGTGAAGGKGAYATGTGGDAAETGDYSVGGAGGSDEGASDAGKAAVTGAETLSEDERELKFENVKLAYVHREDFKHDPARTFQEVNWVAFRAFMTKKEMRERKSFNQDVVAEVQVHNEKDERSLEDYSPRAGEQYEDSEGTVAVWEVWDRKANSVCWIARGSQEVLEEGEPYLELDGFFPCPIPAYGTITNDSLIPVPDYTFYQDQADEIDQLTARIGALTDALKLVGFYPGGPSGEGSPEIERAFRPGFENKMIAVQSWAAFKESGGGQAPVIFLPVEQVGKIIEGCVKLRQQIVEDVYQIVGLSDIMRGATDPQETAQAQQMKAQFGGVRLRDRQAELARFCADICKLVGQIISVHCQPSIVMKMTNIPLPNKADVMQMAMQQMLQYRQQIAPMVSRYQQQALHVGQGPMMPGGQPGPVGPAQPGQQDGPPGSIPPPPQIPPPPVLTIPPTEEEVFGLLNDNVLRLFRIDIEADSTIIGDESQEKQDRTNLIEAMTKFVGAWSPIIAQAPQMAKLSAELMKFGIRAFRVGRELEEVVEETADMLEKSPGPIGGKGDPKAAAETIKLQGMQIKAQAELQKAQIEAQTAVQEAQAKIIAEQMKQEGDRQKAVIGLAQDSASHQSNIVEMKTQAGLDSQARVHQAALDAAGGLMQAGLQTHARTHQAQLSQAEQMKKNEEGQ